MNSIFYTVEHVFTSLNFRKNSQNSSDLPAEGHRQAYVASVRCL